jgi:hypothetical protein
LTYVLKHVAIPEIKNKQYLLALQTLALNSNRIGGHSSVAGELCCPVTLTKEKNYSLWG